MNKIRELLKEALEAWNCNELNDFSNRMEEIANFLDEPEADPVGFVNEHLRFTGGFNVRLNYGKDIPENGTPLYTRPEPSRKPLTDDEIEKGMDVNALSHFEACAFASGIRFAEKHHGIGDNVV